MRLIDRLLQPRCLLCGDPGLPGMALCRGCHADLPRNDRACVRCAEALPATGPGLPPLRVCGRCLWHPPPYTAVHVPFRYEPPIDWLVQRLKFNADLAAGRLLGQLLAQAIAGHADAVTHVIPLPLHPRRLIERGFNQAGEIARPLAQDLKRPIRGTVLARKSGLTTQMSLPARQRRANVRGVFRTVREPPAGNLLLVDDVVTTASTIREAARSLDAAGNCAVMVCAVARA